ncbi:MAG: FAD-binding oxidoreductase [Acidimicrobiia bacterium]|nr:FAD-binding oxidoreductase [Acidimicrobiia bacterium]MDH3398385.1 FAD-binding oxidoreductase [Acidimicrobiia bacterium]
MDDADVVVIGGGIIGSSIAFQLASRDVGRVVVVEKGAGPAEGSTGASSAIVRTLYSRPETVRLALHGQTAYRNWAEFTGIEQPRSRFHPIGMLWLMGYTNAEAAAARDRLIAEGGVAEVLDAAGVRTRFPALSTCAEPFDLTGQIPHSCRDLEAALYEPDAGFADPTGANQDLIEAARREGAEVLFRSEVQAVRTDPKKVSGVDLTDGRTIRTPLIVNAAGPWCNRLNDMAGVRLGWTISPTRVQVAYRLRPAEVPEPIPVVADAATGIYFRPEASGQQIVFGSVLPEDESERVDPDHLKTGADATFLDSKIHALHHRIPALPHRGTVTGIAGLYAINEEDVHPVIGPTSLDGWWVANGFSGHGFKLAPMVGSMMAQAITGTTRPFDTDVPLSFLSVDRTPLTVQEKSVLA